MDGGGGREEKGNWRRKLRGGQKNKIKTCTRKPDFRILSHISPSIVIPTPQGGHI
jgi:hypothetical protein